MTPAADPLFPASFLYDGPGQLGARFGSLAANPYVQVDLQGVSYGDGAGEAAVGNIIAYAEAVLNPALGTFVESDWVVETSPTAAQDARLRVQDDTTMGSADHGGNDRSLYLVVDTEANATAKLAVTLRAGHGYKMTAWCMKALTEDPADAANVNDGNVTVRLYSPTIGKYLTPAGAWTSTPTDLVSAGAYDSGATWYGISGGFVVFTTDPAEPSADVVVEVQLRTTDEDTAGRFDDLAIISATDIMAVMNGHNISPALAPTWKTSDAADFSGPTTRATFTATRHQFHALVEASFFARYHRLVMTGTPAEKVYLSDLVLGLSQTLPRTPMEKVDITYQETGQSRLATPGGTEHVSNRGPYPPRTLRLAHRFRTAAEEEAARAILIDGLRGGEVPALMMPSTLHFPDLAVYGRLEQAIDFSMATHGKHLEDAADAAALEHYSDMTLTFREGAGFEIA
jgi:hypothetical protein